MRPTELLHPKQRQKSNAYLVDKLREAVYSWRERDYEGTTATSYRLLNYWFNEDHLVNNEPFEFWFCQREAIETLIYVYEVMKKRNFIDMAREFGEGPIQGYDPSYDKYPLYAFKMATGSGKTYVMALSIVWQYFNYKKENKDEYTSKFLIIAGEKNVIYDRLKRDFENGKIFKELPLIPPEWIDEFDLKVILKEDPIYTIPEGVLFLTNIQQLEERINKKEEVEEFVNNTLKLEKVKKHDIYQENRIKEVLTTCPNIMILKDEAHHIYHFEKAWKKILLELHQKLIDNFGKGINMELDFSATPKTETGTLFPWIIVDFSLKEAIEMNIVKRPIKGILKDVREVNSKKVVTRYRAWIDAGIKRWREYKEKLKPLNKKPILFFQCPKNEEADEIYKYLNSIPDLKGKVLLIHTDSTGEISKKYIPEARKFAKTIDEPDPKKNPYEVIVSTLMLNEGWDVKNVNVIVGLRPYTAERRVLPEQVIGRGLRKMFPEEPANIEKCINTLEIIGPPGLTQIIEDLEKEEGIKFAEFDVTEPINLIPISVDENKKDKDIQIPKLSPRITIKEFNVNEADIDKLPPLSIPFEDKVFEMEYIGIDLIKGIKVVRRKWNLPVPKDSKSVIAYYTDLILKELRMKNVFATFYPLVKKYVAEKLFNIKINFDDPRVIYNLSRPEVEENLIKVFVDAFKNMTFKEREPELKEFIKLSDTKPFVWQKQLYKANKCIFNYVPCDNDFEVEFAKFLDQADDVVAFSKIVPKIGFFIEYKDSKQNLRLYYPDFVALINTDEHLIIEIKGREDVDVAYKDNRTRVWCEDASKLTSQKWRFFRINQEEFFKHRFKSVYELISTSFQ